MKIQCHTGLAGRVVAIANGLHLFGEVKFGWAVNSHCPCNWSDLFPNGIDGVTFVKHDPNRGMTRVECRPIDLELPGVDYMPVVKSLCGNATKFDCALVARFHRHPDIDHVHFAVHASRHCYGSVLLLCDSHRDAIRHIIESETKCKVTLPQCLELSSDLDRTPDSVVSFAKDWKSAMSCARVIAPDRPSGLVIPRTHDVIRIPSTR